MNSQLYKSYGDCSDSTSIFHVVRRGVALIGLMLLGFFPSPVAGQSPPQYQLTWLGEGRPRDLNESGVVAFGWGAYIYDHSTGSKFDVNQLGASWVDLEDQSDETGRWSAWHLNGINELNQVIGTAEDVLGLEADRNFILSDPTGPAPLFQLIPRTVLDGSTYIVSINDLGEIAHGNEISNAGVIVRDSSIIDANGNVQLFAGDHFSGINDSGMVTGYREGTSSGPPSGRRNGGTLLFQYPGTPTLLVVGTANYHGDVNNLGDVAFCNDRGYIHIAGSAGPVNLDNLIVAQSPQDLADWLGTSILPSGINDAGQIIGQAALDGVWHGFLLTPIPPDPNAPLVYNSGDTPKSIPDNKPAGVTSTIITGSVGGNTTIVSLAVTLNISHARPSDLTAYLTGPDGVTQVQLTQLNGLNEVTAFDGLDLQGTWTLKVVDSVKQKTGTLNGWSLSIER